MASFYFVGYGHENEVGHQVHHVARVKCSPASWFVFFVKAADELFKNHAHAVIVQRRQAFGTVVVQHRQGAEIDGRIHKLFNDRTKNVRLNHCGNLIAELEFVENLLNVFRKAVEVGDEIRLELLGFGARGQILEAKRRGVAECLTGGIAKRRRLPGDFGLVQHRLHGEDGILGIFQNGVETADNGHGQDDVTVLAASIYIAQAVVCNIPDEVGNLIMLMGVHEDSEKRIFMQKDYRKKAKQLKQHTRGRLTILSNKTLRKDGAKTIVSSTCPAGTVYRQLVITSRNFSIPFSTKLLMSAQTLEGPYSSMN